MAHQLAHGFCRSLEWMLVAMVCGCTLWVTFLALGFAPPVR
jgi:hypothetical protein